MVKNLHAVQEIQVWSLGQEDSLEEEPCHLFLKSSASVRSISFLSFIVPIFAGNVPLVSLIFLQRSLVFPILLFSCISLHCSLKKGFLSLLAILWNSAFKWVYLSFSPLLLLLFFSQLFVRPPITTILSLCIYFSWKHLETLCTSVNTNTPNI